jgi:hypothetical protein
VNDRKWEYIRDMIGFLCVTFAFSVMMHYCTYCSVGKVP